jgi:hypothetical protein
MTLENLCAYPASALGSLSVGSSEGLTDTHSELLTLSLFCNNNDFRLNPTTHRYGGVGYIGPRRKRKMLSRIVSAQPCPRHLSVHATELSFLCDVKRCFIALNVQDPSRLELRCNVEYISRTCYSSAY